MVAGSPLPDLPELTAEQAEHWVAAALAEARALRQHDEHLFPNCDKPSALRASHQLHAAWRRWADHAESIRQRLRPLLHAGQRVNGADELGHAVGRALAMLTITPEDQLQALEQIRRGHVVPIAEVRRELRDRVQ